MLLLILPPRPLGMSGPLSSQAAVSPLSPPANPGLRVSFALSLDAEQDKLEEGLKPGAMGRQRLHMHLNFSNCS